MTTINPFIIEMVRVSTKHGHDDYVEHHYTPRTTWPMWLYDRDNAGELYSKIPHPTDAELPLSLEYAYGLEPVTTVVTMQQSQQQSQSQWSHGGSWMHSSVSFTDVDYNYFTTIINKPCGCDVTTPPDVAAIPLPASGALLFTAIIVTTLVTRIRRGHSQ